MAAGQGGKGASSPFSFVVNSSMAGGEWERLSQEPELRQSLQHLPMERIGFKTVPPGENWV